MKAMILAAGRGERMRPLTDVCPKPLLKVADKPLLVYHIEKLVAIGIKQIVINHAWLGEQIEQTIGDGAQWGAQISFSPEPAGGLETAGGIVNALPLLGDEPFLVVNGDIWTDFDFALLPQTLNDSLAHLVLVDNPLHNVDGDFILADDSHSLLTNKTSSASTNQVALTFSGIAVYHPDIFAGLTAQRYALGPLLKTQITRQNVVGQYYSGLWTDVGTIERLAALEKQLATLSK
ncbi:MAG: MurNAc alpha-1-phosphate uridylyltransferase [Alteromonadaceae bacterium]|jgi:MurNAc alpha-1-phosphate uridylyltransferase